MLVRCKQGAMQCQARRKRQSRVDRGGAVGQRLLLCLQHARAMVCGGGTVLSQQQVQQRQQRKRQLRWMRKGKESVEMVGRVRSC